MNKKGQAALEYLSTYIWALMVLAVALGVIYVFLDYKPETLVPETCSFGDSFNCKDFMINGTNSMVLVYANNAVGTDLTLNSLICHYDGKEYRTLVKPGVNSGCSNDFLPNGVVYDDLVCAGSDFVVYCNMTGANLKSKSKVDFTLVYYKKDMSFPSSSDGFVSGNIVK